jgi:hypothetical protein
MSEFIKIKNMRGTGDTLVKTSVIYVVYDKKEGGAVIEADVAGQPMKINTASTAAEVLAAIEGAQEPFSLPEVGMTLAEYNELLRAAGR